MIGIVAGGGRIDKPMLKAGRSYLKYKVKRNSSPKVRGVAMNPVEHPHGGGNHQHIGKASTVKRGTSAGSSLHSRGLTNMLVVTTTMGMLHGVHSHTTYLRRAVPLDLVLMVRTTSLQHGLVNTASTSNNTNHSSVC